MKSPAAACLLLLAACGATYEVPVGASPAPVAAPSYAPGAARSTADFSRVVSRVEPVAESFCREENAGAPPAWARRRREHEA